jgi:hypothetical protein
MNQFIDVHGLTVLGGGTMVIEDLHCGGSVAELLTGCCLPWPLIRMVEKIVGGIRR